MRRSCNVSTLIEALATFRVNFAYEYGFSERYGRVTRDRVRGVIDDDFGREETLSLRRAPSLVSRNGNGDKRVKQRARCHTYARASERERKREERGERERERERENRWESRATTSMTMTTATTMTKTMTMTMKKFAQARLPIRSAHASLLTIQPTSLESFPWVK